ncbi:multidrug ABC transporter permease [Sphaerisporangium melleum]|uniref:Multidrug ABC transporter permease n=1 Tax=Sphaerisporangium melleum TaxID=321316 RepID=A0A917VQ12_9ACTN|nr:ABC transporter ATP-binding protein [Sphaerisporangium melleum]GGL02907.1 multidrug ABC transporter permease [Sphaerisporangium melleum]GII69464.1 multidrug ABC transporter permease [Sphaerisporangium melleum]
MAREAKTETAGGLIGVDDVETPYWSAIDQQVSSAGVGRIARTAPRMVALMTRRAWRAAPGLTLATGLVQLGVGIATTLGLLATANVFVELLERGPTPDRLLAALPALGWVVASYAVRGLLDAANGAAQAALAPRVERAVEDDLYTAVMGVDLPAFDDADFTELVRNASATSLQSLRHTTAAIGDLVASLVSVAAATVGAGLLHPLLAPVVLLTAVPQGWASIQSARLAYDAFNRMTSQLRRRAVTAGLITSRSDAAEIRAFTAQDLLLAEHRRISLRLMHETLDVEHKKNLVRLAGRTLAGVGTAVAYLVLGALIYTGALPLALAGAAVLAMRTATGAVGTIVRTGNQLYESSLYHDIYQNCLDDARRRTRRRALGAGPALPAAGPSVIELTGVSFTYPGQPEPALAQVSLTLRSGQLVAVIGENGSGKSTLAKLLTGLYLPGAGTVTWDGVDITAVDPVELHSRIAVVMQSPTQWPMTAANNIRIGRLDRPDPGDASLMEAATRSGAHDVITALADGYDTMLSRHFQTGRDLSGGQWQRISVARALYRDAPLVIADEPTAALDARAEHAVFTALRDLHTTGHDHGKITVLITHRLANVRHADLIVVLDHGRIAATGTHDQLITQQGKYAELFHLQADAYSTDHPAGTQSNDDHETRVPAG